MSLCPPPILDNIRIITSLAAENHCDRTLATARWNLIVTTTSSTYDFIGDWGCSAGAPGTFYRRAAGLYTTACSASDSSPCNAIAGTCSTVCQPLPAPWDAHHCEPQQRDDAACQQNWTLTMSASEVVTACGPLIGVPLPPPPPPSPPLNVLQLGIFCRSRPHGVTTLYSEREFCDHVHHAVDLINDKSDGEGRARTTFARDAQLRPTDSPPILSARLLPTTSCTLLCARTLTNHILHSVLCALRLP